jgi:hypothetical protein
MDAIDSSETPVNYLKENTTISYRTVFFIVATVKA